MGETIRHRRDNASEKGTRMCVSRFHRFQVSDCSPKASRDRGRRSGVTKTSSIKSWWNDPERKRQRRISSYKYYAAESNVKRSLNTGLYWLRKKCSLIIHSF